MPHVLAKPASSACNLSCDYCFYLDKPNRGRMSLETLRLYVTQYADACQGGPVDFVWQGGEPTLMGVDFYKEAVALQTAIIGPGRFTNSLQTNATLLGDTWCQFLAEEDFLVGVSVDGPEPQHEAHRGAWAKTMKGIEQLKAYGVPFNSLTVVTAENAVDPVGLYHFLSRTVGGQVIQFLPLETSLAPEQYGEFLIAIFDKWLATDVGIHFVQAFEAALAIWHGYNPGTCEFLETCGDALAIEADGSVYSCDHYVDAEHRLGDVRSSTIAAMVQSAQQRAFGATKRMPGCAVCKFKRLCYGGCPKQAQYFCKSFMAFFTHTGPWMAGAQIKESPDG